MKIICLLPRRADLTRAQFKQYYEENHAPLIEKLLPFYTEYRRNFLADEQDYETGHLENKAEDAPPFDVITELTFSTRENYEKMVAALSDPAIGDVIAADEANLFDRDNMQVYLVEEVASAAR
ncbi:EthD family reductase [Mangrovimicrobium sediminis]|uniref:EthD family reductase n=1 Tax=Mangrovimicrobium sediminis TaxID=2562682 RepID=A0A4Z0M8U9_9GAMM|nr:EthD domain-containing protein [Haliea sp. SAOS-164]TGD75725.1 EthD family reductase [Haliea sp. SAOS-164]